MTARVQHIHYRVRPIAHHTAGHSKPTMTFKQDMTVKHQSMVCLADSDWASPSFMDEIISLRLMNQPEQIAASRYEMYGRGQLENNMPLPLCVSIFAGHAHQAGQAVHIALHAHGLTSCHDMRCAKFNCPPSIPPCDMTHIVSAHGVQNALLARCC